MVINISSVCTVGRAVSKAATQVKISPSFCVGVCLRMMLHNWPCIIDKGHSSVAQGTGTVTKAFAWPQ